MKKINWCIIVVLGFVLSMTLSGCNSAGGVGNGQKQNGVVIGSTSTGASIYISSSKFDLTPDVTTSGVIGITSGSDTYSSSVAFSVARGSGVVTGGNLPQVVLNPSSCSLNSTSSTGSTCTMLIIGNSALPGTYTVTASIMNNGVSQSLNSFTVVISSQTNPIKALKLILTHNSVKVGGDVDAVLVLDNATVATMVNPVITSSNTKIATISGPPCQLTIQNNKCDFVIHGTGLGTVNIIATADGYKDAKTSFSVVGITPKYGDLVLTLSQNKVRVGSTVTATANLVGDSIANNVTINFLASIESDVSITPISCTIIAPSRSCTVSIVAKNSGDAVLITASNPENLYKDSSDVLMISDLYLYVVGNTNGSIYAYKYIAGGAVIPLGHMQNIASIAHSSNLLANPLGSYLYALDTFSNIIDSYSIGTGGVLSSNVLHVSVPIASNYMARDSSGKILYITSDYSNNVAAYYMDNNNGGLNLLAMGSEALNSGPSGMAIKENLNGTELLYVANKNKNSLSVYNSDVAHGLFTLESTVFLPSLNQPFRMAFDKKNSMLFVLNAGYGSSGNASVSVYNAQNSVPEFVSGNFSAGLEPLLFVYVESKDMLYVIGRNYINPYKISGSANILTPLSQVVSGDNFSNATSDPAGTHLYISNTSQNSIDSYAIQTNGEVVFESRVVSAQSPDGITFN